MIILILKYFLKIKWFGEFFLLIFSFKFKNWCIFMGSVRQLSLMLWKTPYFGHLLIILGTNENFHTLSAFAHQHAYIIAQYLTFFCIVVELVCQSSIFLNEEISRYKQIFLMDSQQIPAKSGSLWCLWQSKNIISFSLTSTLGLLPFFKFLFLPQYFVNLIKEHQNMWYF